MYNKIIERKPLTISFYINCRYYTYILKICRNKRKEKKTKRKF